MNAPFTDRTNETNRRYQVIAVPFQSGSSSELSIGSSDFLPKDKRNRITVRRISQEFLNEQGIDSETTRANLIASRRALRKMHREALRHIVEAEKIIRRSHSTRRCRSIPPRETQHALNFTYDTLTHDMYGKKRSKSLLMRPPKRKQVAAPSYFDRTMSRARMIENKKILISPRTAVPVPPRIYPIPQSSLRGKTVSSGHSVETPWPAFVASKRDIRMKALTFSGNRKHRSLYS